MFLCVCFCSWSLVLKLPHLHQAQVCVLVFTSVGLCFFLVTLCFSVRVYGTTTADLRASGSWSKPGARSLLEYMKDLGHASVLLTFFF